jgi:hypothetical protein
MHNLIKSYLSNRKATVKIENEFSNLNNVNYGVPQGSVLGPLLFLIYTNDIMNSIDRTQLFLFADDTILISINHSYAEMKKNLQYDFNLLRCWFMDNELFMSKEKTIQMDITVPKMKIVNNIHISLHDANCNVMRNGKEEEICQTNCKKLDIQKTAKYLGLYIDEHWKFKNQILAIITKLRQILPKIYQIKDVLNMKNKMIIYEAWISSHLRYGIEVYGFAAEYLIERLQKIQNKIVKLLFGKNNIKTEHIYKEKKILKVLKLRDYTVIINNYFTNKHKKFNKDKLLRIRTTTQRLEVPRWNNAYGTRNKNWYIPVIFNKLPKIMLNYITRESLKGDLKVFLLHN